jgi:hypothetical protein
VGGMLGARRSVRGRARRVLVLCTLALCLGSILTTAPAHASTSVVDGISDQSLPTWDGGFPGDYFGGFFASRWIAGGHIRLARFVAQWNVMREPDEGTGNHREQFEAWVQDVGSLGLIPDLALTSFDGVHPSSPAEYKTLLADALNEARALGHPIQYLEAWNEPNNQGAEPPALAAAFANEAQATCAEGYGCTVVAGDFEDAPHVARYERSYEARLDFHPDIWGLHPYYSVEELSVAPARKLIAHLPDGGAGARLWITEVAARECHDYNGHLVMFGEREQAAKASWLVNHLIPSLEPEHVFYYEFLLGEHRQPTCDAQETEDAALYQPSTDANALDAPRPAAAFIFAGKGLPWAYTGEPVLSGPGAATLTGSVYPGGSLDARYRFEYGTTGSYGSSTAAGDAGSALRAVGESATVGGLVEGATYHYRIVAWNAEGTDYGADVTVTMPLWLTFPSWPPSEPY